MNSDLVYYVAVILLALGVLIICGGGISYGYVSEGRWGQRRGDQEPTRPQKNDSTGKWRAYAVESGALTQEEADALGRDAIIARIDGDT